jgi:hypothetical protein
MVTREQRLRDAVESSVGRVVAASVRYDEQVMLEALGECLTWVCALDQLLEDPATDYESRRNTDRDGRFLLGLRHARNTIVHGDDAVDIADAATAQTARVVFAGASSHSRVITPTVPDSVDVQT